MGILLLLLTLAPAQTDTQRYLRPSGNGFTLESEVTWKKTTDGFIYRSVTHRGSTVMDLTIQYDAKRAIRSASIRLKTKKGISTAKARITNGKAEILHNNKVSQTLKSKGPLVLVTTAPDWSDIILSLQRYDQKKGGKQTFEGLWFHATTAAHLRTFIVEKLGEMQKLGKYRVTLRSGDYLVWADDKGTVVRLRKPKRLKGAIVLQGFEKLTKGW